MAAAPVKVKYCSFNARTFKCYASATAWLQPKAVIRSLRARCNVCSNGRRWTTLTMITRMRCTLQQQFWRVFKISFVSHLHLRDVYAASMGAHTLPVKWVFWYSACAPMCTAMCSKSWGIATRAQAPWSNVYQNRLLWLRGRALGGWEAITKAENRDESWRESVGVWRGVHALKERGGEEAMECEHILDQTTWVSRGEKKEESVCFRTKWADLGARHWEEKRWADLLEKKTKQENKNKVYVNESKGEGLPSSFHLLG